MRGKGTEACSSPCPGSHGQVGGVEARCAGCGDDCSRWEGGSGLQKMGRESVPEVLGTMPRNLGLAVGATEAFK